MSERDRIADSLARGGWAGWGVEWGERGRRWGANYRHGRRLSEEEREEIRRQDAQHARPPVLTARDIDLLAALWQVRYLSTSQICRLFFAGAVDACHRRLKKVHDAGYMDKFRPLSLEGPEEWIYRLGSPGFEVLKKLGRVPVKSRLVHKEILDISYVFHDVVASELIVETILQHARHYGTSGALNQLARFSWLGPDRGLIQRQPGPSPFPEPGKPTNKTHPDAFPQQSQRGYLVPDATLVGRLPNGEPFVLLFEVDLTARPSKNIDKLRRYDRFLLDGWKKSRWRDGDMVPAVLFVVPHEKHIPAFLECADEHLTAFWRRDDYPNRAYYPGREQIAFTTFEQIKSGQWLVWQVAERHQFKRHPGDEPGGQPFRWIVPQTFAGPETHTPTDTLPDAA